MEGMEAQLKTNQYLEKANENRYHKQIEDKQRYN